MTTATPSDPLAFRAAHSVLVVDDNPATKYAVARSLRACGYRTVEASGGAEALELSEFVSAVVLDVHLPDLDGFEVCRLLRARRSTARLPVIHMSAVRLEEADSQARDCGASGFLPAPVDPSVLASKLDQLLVERVPAELPGDRSGAGAQSVLDGMAKDEQART